MATNFKLKFRILEKYQTQDAFATIVNVNPVVVSYVVGNHRSISPDEKQRWAKALSCKVSDIF